MRRFKIVEQSNTTIYRGVITAEDLRKQFKIPDKAEITVMVPTGGDWSGTELEIGKDVPGIRVQWENVK